MKEKRATHEKRATYEQKAHGYGDVWTYYALDQDHKLVIAYRVLFGPESGGDP